MVDLAFSRSVVRAILHSAAARVEEVPCPADRSFPLGMIGTPRRARAWQRTESPSRSHVSIRATHVRPLPAPLRFRRAGTR